MYEDGLGLEKNINQAMFWYNQVERQGQIR